MLRRSHVRCLLVTLATASAVRLASHRVVAPSMAFYPVKERKMANPVKTALKKKSGAITVSVEVARDTSEVAPIDEGEVDGPGQERRTTALTADERLTKLSSELRGGREGALASAIWTSDVDALGVLAAEQQSAKGDFPGPVPIVYSGDDVEAAVAAGASAVVLSAADREGSDSLGVEIVWDVATADDIRAIVDDESAPEDAFLIRCDVAASAGAPASEAADQEAAEAAKAAAAEAAAAAAAERVRDLVAALPPSAVGVAAVEAMQPADAEIATARALATAGCKAVLVRNACVGTRSTRALLTFV